MNETKNSRPMEEFMTRMLYFGMRPKVALVTDSESILQVKQRLVGVGEKMDVRSFRVHWDRSRELTSLLPTLDASDCDVVVLSSCNPVAGCLEEDSVLAAFARMKTMTVSALGGVAPKLEQCAACDLRTAESVLECLEQMASGEATRRPEYMSNVNDRVAVQMEQEVARRVELLKAEWERERAMLEEGRRSAEVKTTESCAYAEEVGAELMLTRRKLKRRTAWLWVMGLLFVLSVVACAYFAELIPMLLG